MRSLIEGVMTEAFFEDIILPASFDVDSLFSKENIDTLKAIER